MFKLPEIESLRALLPDGRLLIVTRIVRMFGYGAISVILALYLAAMGLDERGIGLLLTATLVGDALLSLLIAGVADRLGRREMLLVGAGGGTPLVTNILQGGDVVQVATMIPYAIQSLIVRPEIKTTKDLAGRKIGVSRLGAIPHFTLQAIAKLYNVQGVNAVQTGT